MAAHLQGLFIFFGATLPNLRESKYGMNANPSGSCNFIQSNCASGELKLFRFMKPWLRKWINEELKLLQLF